MNKSLFEISNDKTSGSTDLLIRLSRLLLKHIKNKKSFEQLLNDAENLFNSFGIINNYLKRVKKTFNSADEEHLKRIISAPLHKHSIYEAIFHNALPYLLDAKIVFTLSNSKTVFEVLKLLKKQRRGLKVFITESRPGNEGRILAQKLLREDTIVELGTDAAMSSCISRCDVVLCGADKLLKDGSAVNKTGSLNAAIIAQYYKKPFYIVSESEKFASSFRKDYRDPSEVWKKRETKLNVVNIYFERIDPILITKIFTEK